MTERWWRTAVGFVAIRLAKTAASWARMGR